MDRSELNHGFKARSKVLPPAIAVVDGSVPAETHSWRQAVDQIQMFGELQYSLWVLVVAANTSEVAAE